MGNEIFEEIKRKYKKSNKYMLYVSYEDIEDRKVQIEYNNVFNKGVKSVEDKIKAKIEELENQKRQWIEDRDNKHKDSEIIYAIEVLQSLFGKE